ncbi:GNAT family N-acetyltransferase [Polaromonas naphthalenivorans]|uniref:GNAT family N-acetyltransferase n=1 Tax=Polaromonas naphthalenivorans TaxID=216465 RepID=UPI0009FED84F
MGLQRLWLGTPPGHKRSQEHSCARTFASSCRNPLPLGRGGCQDLFVLPEFRTAGLGKALMLAAHDEARASGIARMDLSTAKTNVKAQALYESLGWKRDDVFLAYHWEPTYPLPSQAAQGKAEAPENIPSLNVITHKE